MLRQQRDHPPFTPGYAVHTLTQPGDGRTGHGQQAVQPVGQQVVQPARVGKSVGRQGLIRRMVDLNNRFSTLYSAVHRLPETPCHPDP